MNIFDPRKPWERLAHRKREDGLIDLLRPNGSVMLSFLPPEGGMTDEEFAHALARVAQVAETEKFGPS